MQNMLRNVQGITKVDVAIVFVTVAILAVVAVPRHNRETKIAEAKDLISTVQAAADEAVRNLSDSGRSGTDAEPLPPDEVLLQTLQEKLGGAIPPNPFTKNNHVHIKHHTSLKPCDCLDPNGGWVWNLTSPQGKQKPHRSVVWLNSDTVHIGKGNGEACIQP